jgi:hypothetical protein
MFYIEHTFLNQPVIFFSGVEIPPPPQLFSTFAKPLRIFLVVRSFLPLYSAVFLVAFLFLIAEMKNVLNSHFLSSVGYIS